MAEAPRLPVPVEHRLLKAACELPPRVQRRLFGPPPLLDGQTLASDIQAMIVTARRSGVRSYTNGLPPLEAREANRAGAASSQARPPIPMAEVRDFEIPGPAGTLPVRLYSPFGPPPIGDAAALPLILFFHGGGWVIGDLDTHDGVCRFLAAATGAAVLSVDYRLSPEHPFPAAVDDAWASFVWAAANAGELGCDPARIAVSGDSAGGNLAAGVAVRARDEGGPAPAFQLLFYPVTDSDDEMRSRSLFSDGFMLTRADMENFEGHYLPPGTDVDDPRVSILKTPDLSNLAPAYVATAGFDPLRDEGEAYGLRMREAGVKVSIRRHPGLIHGFANLTAVSRTSRGAMREAAGALRLGLAP
jgi:acetyl esterase